MSPRTKGLLIALPIVATLAFFADRRIGRLSEPTYHDQPLSYWVEEYRTTSTFMIGNYGQEPGQLRESREAIHAIGTNALPSLVAWMGYQPPFWGTRFMPWAPLPVRNKVDRAFFSLNRANRATAAMAALELLGTNAAPAIPQLTALAMKTNGNFYIPRCATRVMTHLGPEALPALMNVFSNATPQEKAYVSLVTSSLLLPTINNKESLPWLLQIMRTQYDPLRSAASNAVWRIAPELITNTAAQ